MTVAEPEKTRTDPEQLWTAVMSRDRSLDGRFVYAVRSTGVYCRPTCPSRRPRQEQVCYFSAPEEARNAGYRACLRCLPDRRGTDAELVTLACNYINEHVETNEAPLQLAEISEAVGAAPKHLHGNSSVRPVSHRCNTPVANEWSGSRVSFGRAPTCPKPCTTPGMAHPAASTKTRRSNWV